MDRERLKGNLDLLWLSVLLSGPAHGYGIISPLRDRSGGTFDLPRGDHLSRPAPARGRGPAGQHLGPSEPGWSA